jgi:F-type H+-transporting ATPase subunit a
MEHELWLTAWLNRLLGGVVTSLLLKIGFRPADAAHPIPNYIAMEWVVILVILAVAIWLRSRLSVENPGKLQQAMEVVLEFTQNLADEIIGHGGRRYVTMLGTLGIFVVLCNLLGLIPLFRTPTAYIQVTLGLAIVAFLYYNLQGLRQHGLVGYLKRLCGPLLALAVIMFPIEVLGNLGRMLSLSVRLYANMLVGDLLEKVFGGLVPIAVPVVFAALHIFVSILQAYIFMLLPAVYISMAVSEEH